MEAFGGLIARRHVNETVSDIDAERSPRPVDLVVLPGLYFLAAKVSVLLTVMPEGMATLWLPNGILLAAFLRFGGRAYLPCAALALIAEVAADINAFKLSEALLFGLNNIAEATLAYALLVRWRFNPHFTRPFDLLKFVAAGPLLAAFAAGCIGAAIYSSFRGAHTGYVEFLRVWWFGDALGVMIVTPFLLGFWTKPSSTVGTQRAGHALDALIGLAALGALALLIASRDGMLWNIHVGPVLLLPFVLYLAARFPFRSAAGAVASAALVILVLTTAGRNPFGHASLRDTVVHAQEFIFVMSLMALGLSALLTQLRMSQRDLELANTELRARHQALAQSHAELQRAEAEVVALNDGLEGKVRERTRELEEALAQVKRLQGLLPICAWCKRVRDGHNDWHSVEAYVAERTDATFSHSICPHCLAKHF